MVSSNGAKATGSELDNGHTKRRPEQESSSMTGPQDIELMMRKEETTDRTRWRLIGDHGEQKWTYLKTDEEVAEWPQSTADKYHLGLDTNLPNLSPPKTPLDSLNNALTFFEQLQLPPGQWACEYGGPMFLLPGLVITWYVTKTPIPMEYRNEIRNYLFARQNKNDHGWGLHIEGVSSVFGTAMNYTTLRLLGVREDDMRMFSARALLQKMGGAVNGPHWAKFWLSVLGVCEWEAVNPVPPELWLLPNWAPIAPWRWWIHMRQVFLPMGYIWSKRFSYPLDDITRSLRDELYTQPYNSISFASHRNSISPLDNYHPKSALLNTINWFLVNVHIPILRPLFSRPPFNLTRRAETWAYELIELEDENSDYANLGPVNNPMNTLACYIHDGPSSYAVRRHLERLHDFLWIKDEGMLMNGTNGVQTWDTALLCQAVIEAGVADQPRWRPMLLKALEFLDDQQIREEPRKQNETYRQSRKGAWAFSNRVQGYTVSDCTSEGLKSVILLQSLPSFPTLVNTQRQHDAIDVLLTMQNANGGFSSYEPRRGNPDLLEQLNAAEVFGRIMVEYDYPECTTAVVTALDLFHKHHPAYRAAEIKTALDRALDYIRAAQRPDGSWYGSWGICFTYAGWFALTSLAQVAGETCANSERVRRACAFFVGKQMADGGWGESYRACETGEWVDHPEGSQVVMTAWVCIALLEARYDDLEVVGRGIRLIMERQKGNGEWLQEGIEGVFNKSCMISYPNYKFIFPIWALGMYAKRTGNVEVLSG